MTRAAVDEGLDTNAPLCAACAPTSGEFAWEQVVRFSVAGEPVPQPRPRVYSTHAVSDTPRSRAWKHRVAHAAKALGMRAPHEPLRVDLLFAMPRPQRLRRAKSPKGAVPHDVKPDVDNLAKCVLDGIYPLVADDDSVVALSAAKFYAPVGSTTGVLITISKLKGEKV